MRLSVVDEIKNYYQLYAKNGKVGAFKLNFDRNRTCPICGKPSIESHSISEKYLRTIADQNQKALHVPHLFNDKNMFHFMEPKSVGHISTFFGFCKDHDADLFAPLENFSGLPDTNRFQEKEAVLMSLRAVAHREYDNTLMVKSAKQHDKYVEQKCEAYLRATKYYMDLHLKALSNPKLLDYFRFDMPLELQGNFLCAAYDDGISIITIPVDTGQLVGYVVGSVASSKIHIYYRSPHLVISKALNNNIAVSPDWWGTRTESYRNTFLSGALSGKTIKTVYHGRIVETVMP
jgi:hypothetical protein